MKELQRERERWRNLPSIGLLLTWSRLGLSHYEVRSQPTPVALCAAAFSWLSQHKAGLEEEWPGHESASKWNASIADSSFLHHAVVTVSAYLCVFFQMGDHLFFSFIYPGKQVLPPGTPLGNGLTPEAAKDLGLPSGIAVATSLIDAHAGGLGNLLSHLKLA